MVALMRRKGKGPIIFPYNSKAKLLFYDLLTRWCERFVSIDRVKALAIYLFERACYVQDREGKLPQEIILQNLLASYIISSTLLDKYPAIIEQTLNDIKTDLRSMKIAMRSVLLDSSIDLYIATSYDILAVLSNTYSKIVQEVSKTLLQISYYSKASSKDPEIVALACLRYACDFTKEAFINNVENIEKLDEIDDDFKELSETLLNFSDSLLLLKATRRGARTLLIYC